MNDHPKHVRGVQEAYSQYNTPPVYENNAVGEASNSRGKSGAGNLLASSSDDDDEARVNSDLLTAWTQRMQVLTVVTTFLSSMDGILFSLTALNTQIGLPTSTASRELIYSCLSGALVLHVCGCILGYIASFALIRYRIIEASGEDDKVGSIQPSGLGAAQLAQRVPRRIVLEPVRPLHEFVTFLQRLERLQCLSVFLSSRSSPPPLSLLTHCYHTTLCLTSLGFILALTGVLAYIWAGMPVSVGIFSTVCLGIGISASVWALAT